MNKLKEQVREIKKKYGAEVIFKGETFDLQQYQIEKMLECFDQMVDEVALAVLDRVEERINALIRISDEENSHDWFNALRAARSVAEPLRKEITDTGV